MTSKTSRPVDDDDRAGPLADATKSRSKVNREATRFGAIALAELLVPALTGQYRYCPETREWLHYDGARWVSGAGAEDKVLRICADVVNAYAGTLARKGTLTQKENLSEVKLYSTGSCQDRAVKLSRGATGISTPLADFDPHPAPGDPYRVHCANGIVILLDRTGGHAVRKTRPDDLNTLVAAEYDPKATAPVTLAALAKYQPVPAIRNFKLEKYARGLSGMGSETFDVDYGPKAGNGKSTMMTAAASAMGMYAFTIPAEMLAGRGKNSARAEYRDEIAQMLTRRVIMAEEPEAGARYNVALIKELTGGREISVRAMYGRATRGIPRIQLSLAANNRPSWSADAGMERRLCEIPWDYVIPEAERVESFKDIVASEASGFLNEILRHWPGAVPLDVPEELRVQTKTATRDANPFSQFVDDVVIRGDGFSTPAVLYQHYTEWARQNGEYAHSSKRLGLELRREGLEQQTGGTRHYLGIGGLREEYNPAARYRL